MPLFVVFLFKLLTGFIICISLLRDGKGMFSCSWSKGSYKGSSFFMRFLEAHITETKLYLIICLFVFQVLKISFILTKIVYLIENAVSP